LLDASIFSSSMITLIDSITVSVLLLKTLYAQLFVEYPKNTPSSLLGSNFSRFSLSRRILHLLPKVLKYLTVGFFPHQIS
jgi:hypothetical protein